MTNPQPDPLSEDAIPEAVASTRSGFSIVWAIPLLAAVIGAWVAYTAFSEPWPVANRTGDIRCQHRVAAGKDYFT